MIGRCVNCGILFSTTSEDAGDPACLCNTCFRAKNVEQEPDERDDSVCEHGIGFDETCEWCDYEEDGPQDLETTLDNAVDRAFQETGGGL